MDTYTDSPAAHLHESLLPYPTSQYPSSNIPPVHDPYLNQEQVGNGEIPPMNYSLGGSGDESSMLNLAPREQVKKELFKRLLISNLVDNIGRTLVLITLTIASFALIASTYSKQKREEKYNGSGDRLMFIISGIFFMVNIVGYWLSALIYMLGRNWIGAFVAIGNMFFRIVAHILLLIAMIQVDRLIGGIVVCCICIPGFSIFMTVYPELDSPAGDVRFGDVLFSTYYIQFGASKVRKILPDLFQYSQVYSGFWSQSSTTIGNTTYTTTSTGFQAGLPDNWKKMRMLSIRNIVLLSWCAIEILIVIVFASIPKFGKHY